MNDQRNPEWKFMLSHEPRSRRAPRERFSDVLEAARAPIDFDGIVSGHNVDLGNLEGENLVANLEISFQDIEALNAGIRVPVKWMPSTRTISTKMSRFCSTMGPNRGSKGSAHNYIRR